MWRAVAAEVKKLREEKKFGLAFEKHIPELSYLHTAMDKASASETELTAASELTVVKL